MKASELRAEARSSLTGKWGKAALFTLIYGVLTFVIAYIASLIPFIGNIAYYVISLPIGYGVTACFIKLKRGEDFSYIDFFELGFKAFGKVWSVFGNIILKLIIPVVILIVSIILLSVGMVGGITSAAIFSSSFGTGAFSILGIIGFIGYIASIIYLVIKGLLYTLSYYILYDNPDMSAKDIVEKSAVVMNGNRGSLVCLGLSFIGWAILSVFTLYIGLFWLVPYIEIAKVIFYEDRIGKLNNEQPNNEPEVIS